MDSTLACLFVIVTFFAAGDALSCCTSSTSGHDVASSLLCASNSSTLLGVNCTSCRKQGSDTTGTWVVVRSCHTTLQTEGCQSSSVLGLTTTTCYCNTDLCNGASSVIMSSLSIALCALAVGMSYTVTVL